MRDLTEREKKWEQYKQLEKELRPEPDLFRKDFEELLIGYEKSLIQSEAAKNTRRSYVKNAEMFIESYTSNDRALTKEDVLQFKEDLEESSYKAKTISLKITTVNRFLYYCEQGEKSIKNIVVQNDNMVSDRVHNHEFRRLHSRAKKIGDLNLYWLIKIMGLTGARFGELKFFTAKSIQNTTITISFKGTTRTIPLPPSLRYELREYVEKYEIKGRIVRGSNQTMNKKLKELAGMCKIKKSKITNHAFRHYFGFRFIEVNGDGAINQLMNLMGHKSLDTTIGYLKGTTADYEESMGRM